MKTNGKNLFLLSCLFITILLGAAEQLGPLNAQWFYDSHNPYYSANNFLQEQQWKKAKDEYQKILALKSGTEYDQNMARVNLATCYLAHAKFNKNWSSFDALIGIPENKRISSDLIKSYNGLRDRLILLRTDQVNTCDIFHFLETAHILKELTGCHIIVSIQNSVKDILSSVATAYNYALVGKTENQPTTDYETHIVSLLGYLNLRPLQLNPSRVIFTPSERALVKVSQHISPLLASNKIIAALLLDKNQKTCIGGRQLSRDSKNHINELNFQACTHLLRKYPELVLIDCGSKNNSSAVDINHKDQYKQLILEEETFDTLIALASIMNDNKKIIALGTDNTRANIFARALSNKAQKRMAFIIPNGSKQTGEYDIRMEGEGHYYTHMLYDNCAVYKCEDPFEHNNILEIAYKDLVNNYDAQARSILLQ